MKRHLPLWLGALLVASALNTPVAGAADYPARPVKFITQGAAGSGPDVIARIVAEHLGRTWSQPVQIINLAGGGGVVAAQSAAGAEPDGYTLYVPTATTFVIMPEMHDTLPVDLDRQFTPIGFLAETPMIIAAAPSLRVNSLQDLVDMAKKRPGELFYAANNRGSMPHLTGELLSNRTGSRLTFVPYAGVAAGLQDVMGGRVPLIVESVGALSGAIRAGSITPLAVTSRQRLPNFPELPTAAETSPGLVAMAWVVLMAPAATPPDIVRKVNQDLNATLLRPEVRERLQELGAFVRPMSPGETAEFIRSEQQVWRPLVRQVGLKSQ